MKLGNLSSNLYRRACICVLFFIAASASFNGFYDKWHLREAGVALGAANGDGDRYGLADMLNGTATRPFVYRQLLPVVANWLDKALPLDAKERIENFSFSSGQGHLMDVIGASPLASDPAYSFRYLVVYTATFFFVWLSVFAMYQVCKALQFPVLACVFAPVVLILMIPYFMSLGGYYYDYPELAFLAIAAWMALEVDWWWMLPVVALASWNKETFMLITLTLYPLIRTRHSRMNAMTGTGFLFATCAAINFWIRQHYAHNGGGAVLMHLRNQIIFLIHPLNLLGMEKTYGVPAFSPSAIAPLVLIFLTVRYGWRWLPAEIRQHGQIAAAINIPLYLFFGMPGELRALSMLYILLLVLIATNLSAEFKADNVRVMEGAERWL